MNEIMNDDMPDLPKMFSSRGRTKIVVLLSIKLELNITDIAKATRLNHNSTSFHLKVLKKMNVLREKKFGRIRVYTYRLEVPKLRALKDFIATWRKKD